MLFILSMIFIILLMFWFANDYKYVLKKDSLIEEFKKREDVANHSADFWKNKYKEIKEKENNNCKYIEHIKNELCDINNYNIKLKDEIDYYINKEKSLISEIISIENLSQEIEMLKKVNETLSQNLTLYQSNNVSEIISVFTSIKQDIQSIAEKLGVKNSNIIERIDLITNKFNSKEEYGCETSIVEYYNSNVNDIDCIDEIIEELKNNSLVITDVLYDVYLYSFVMEYKEKLSFDYKRNVIINDYGIKDKKVWNKKLKEITDNIIREKVSVKLEEYNQKLNKYNISLCALSTYLLINKLELIFIEINSETLHKHIELDSVSNGYDYEYAISDLINNSNIEWIAKVTRATNDQGVDIIAEKDDLIVVIQCKYYKGVVGNKAVQEVMAGLIYYNADYAFVVTNSSFTKSAKQLAKSGDVLLLHHSQIVKELIKISDNEDQFSDQITKLLL